MADQSIRGYLASLEQRGEIVRIAREVDPLENLTAVGWKAYDRLGKGTLFTTVKGHPDWQVANQILTDRRKWGVALGVDEHEVVGAFNERIRTPLAAALVPPGDAPCREVVATGDAVDLRTIPAAWTSEEDPGPFIAAGMAVIKDPDTGARNVSIHRQQILGRDRTGFLICPRQALRIYQKYVARNQPMPVAVAIGAHPALYFAAAFTAPPGSDEFALAGALLGEPVRLVKCETVDLEVPADAELVLEGFIPPHEMVEEGPFGEGSGGYAMEGRTPVFVVTAITRRRRPIFYAMQCGAPMTDAQAIVSTSVDMLLWDHLKNVEGGLDLLDVRCLGVSGLMTVVIRLRPRIEGQAKTACMAALSGPQMHPKIAIAVDEDIDAGDLRQVFWALTTRVDAGRDVIKLPNMRVWSLDNISDIVPGQSPMYRLGTKLIIDATCPVGAASRFAKAMPRNHDAIDIAGFLP